jgi:hypothetical protein
MRFVSLFMCWLRERPIAFWAALRCRPISLRLRFLRARPLHALHIGTLRATRDLLSSVSIMATARIIGMSALLGLRIISLPVMLLSMLRSQ